jgi:hypothetical protein
VKEKSNTMAANAETKRRVPEANLKALKVPRGKSIFEATDGGQTVDAVVYNVHTGQVLIGRAMIHQELLDRYAPETNIDEYVRADLFVARQRVELDTMRAAVWVDRFGTAIDKVKAWNNVFDAMDVFIEMEFPDEWDILVDGKKVN